MSFNTFIDKEPLLESVGEFAGRQYKFSKKDATLKFFNKFVFLYHDIFDDIQYKLKNAVEVNTSKFKTEMILFTSYGITENGDVLIKGTAVIPVDQVFKTADWEFITSPRNFQKIETVYTSEQNYDNAEDAFKTIKKTGVPYVEWRKHN